MRFDDRRASGLTCRCGAWPRGWTTRSSTTLPRLTSRTVNGALVERSDLEPASSTGPPGLRRTSHPPSSLRSHDPLFRQRSRVERSVRVGIERQIATTFRFRVTKARSGGKGAPLANRAAGIASFSLLRNWIMAWLPVASLTRTPRTSFKVRTLETILATAASFRRQVSLGPTRRRGLPPPQPATTTTMAARSAGAVDARPARLLRLAVGRTKDQAFLRQCLTAARS
jgi:hypothetical protein